MATWRWAGGLAVVLVASMVCAETVTFEPPTYTQGDPVNGVDGWVGDSNWLTWGPTFDGTDGMWNNVGGFTTAQTYRDFSQGLTAGTLTYQIRPNDNNSTVHWLLLQDLGGSSYGMQFQARGKSGGVNTNHEFYVFDNGAAESPDIAAIQFIATSWYEVRIDFDLGDTTGGPNGTYDVQVTRLDGTPQVVWDLDDRPMRNPIPNVGRFTDNGSFQNVGQATHLDNISLVPEPMTAALLIAGAALIRRKR